jgi:hypothetical protein
MTALTSTSCVEFILRTNIIYHEYDVKVQDLTQAVESATRVSDQ